MEADSTKNTLIDFLQGRLQTAATLAFAIILAFAVGAVIIAVSGDSPINAYSAMFHGAFGGISRTASTLAKATPLIMTGLSVAVAFNAGIWNIGSEGQFFLGGFAAAWVGFTVKGLPSPIHITLCLAAAALFGAFWAFIPGLLRVKGNTNEVVTTIMANYVATLFTAYLVNYPFKVPGSARGATVYIEKTAELFRPIRFSRFSLGFFIAIGLVVLVYYLMTRTTLGYEWKMVGLNQEFSRYGGISPERAMLTAMLVSGALAAVGGAIEVMGVHQRFIDNISPGYGFDGILIALIAGNNPVGVLLVAIIFGALRTGSIGMEQATTIPSELSSVIQSLIILAVAAQVGFKVLLARMRTKRRQATC
jgi:ABC-type uncharacterized transport system permease subunit